MEQKLPSSFKKKYFLFFCGSQQLHLAEVEVKCTLPAMAHMCFKRRGTLQGEKRGGGRKERLTTQAKMHTGLKWSTLITIPTSDLKMRSILTYDQLIMRYVLGSGGGSGDMSMTTCEPTCIYFTFT